MHIELKWKNRNSRDLGTRIYRSTEPLDINNLPEPIGVAPAGATSYKDSTVERGQKYHYITEVFSSNDSAYSDEIIAYAVRNSGPGPQTLLHGDLECGYYGTCAEKEFFYGSEVLFQVSGNISNLNTNGTRIWYKFAHKGKTLYFPSTFISDRIVWQSLYNWGAVYEKDEDDLIKTTPQGRKIYRGDEVFLVRLPKGSSVNPIPSSGNILENFYGSEVNELVYRISNTFPGTKLGENWVQDWNLIGNGYVLCQEHYGSISSSNRLIRTLYDGSSYTPWNSGSIPWSPMIEYLGKASDE